MLNLVEIGKRVKDLRTKSNLTQMKIAEYLSLDQSMIAKIEKGERNIASDVIEKLASLFCCSVDYLLYGDDSEQKVTVAFRSSQLAVEDLKSLSVINKIVRNQFAMDKMLEDVK